jgi:superfamily II DNA or RNA helicase
MAVLCPPQLCDQWQRELKQKFHIDAVVVRSGTVSKLERSLPAGDSHIFSYYPHLIVSLDYVKSDRRRETFLVHCPDLVIVDEAHTCTHTGGERSTQQQRHQLVQKIAAKSHQHLILLTATPHSGIEASFLSLLGLLNPEFEQFSLDQLNEKQRIELARHFVQRRRIDIQHWLGNETPFPERVSQEKPYSLSKEYRQLFEAVYDFAWRLVKTAEETPLSHAQRRGRYWSALAILRCVMSSPAAAIATLSRQTEKYSVVEETTEDFDEELAATYVYDSTEQEQILDVVPTTIVEKGKQTFDESQKRQLREFVILAKQLQGTNDRKLHQVKTLVKTLLQDGLNPIIWCRYIATAKYVAEALKELETKKTNLRVIAITGEQSEDER